MRPQVDPNRDNAIFAPLYFLRHGFIWHAHGEELKRGPISIELCDREFVGYAHSNPGASLCCQGDVRI